MLREKAGILDNGEKKKSKKRRDDDDMKLIAGSSSMQGAVLPTTNGHINLFEDLEIVIYISSYLALSLLIRSSERHGCCCKGGQEKYS
jgi:hypothetical protein